jgi:hypothetical protein
MAGELTIGARIPSVEIIRSDDWRPFNFHDIAPFDGRYRLFILPGDISTPQGVGALQNFSDGFLSVLKVRPVLEKIIQVYVLIDNEPSVAIEALRLPLALVEGCFQRCATHSPTDILR